MLLRRPRSPLFPYTTLFRSDLVLTDLGMPDLSGWDVVDAIRKKDHRIPVVLATGWGSQIGDTEARCRGVTRDRKSTRLNSSHVRISYAVFCLKKKKRKSTTR